ncbi:hypothetical protein AFK68_08475 [Hydrocoleum sp. CS-953]|uniref:tetratricopeptide repeat protein n=1 Tax=Hydrocoleum sp. CS-953 TaxID=1671698 RepID=UPI000BDA4605|nr:tetratricopeptide repeat protein [Hydrocoleum sp. CS-953]OZH54821.1 hypothetical protein AFK68_08475 [Hydrocoleum sp. CS-953]
MAVSLNDLGFLYHFQGKYGEAEPLYQEALAIYKRFFKTEHPNVTTILKNLALLYAKTNRH